MSRKNTRTYAKRWGAYYDGPEHPWLRDSIITTVLGLVLGGGIGIWIADGYWPLAGSVGLVALFVHGVVLAAGQRVDSSRMERADLLRIAAFGISATIVAAVATLLFSG